MAKVQLGSIEFMACVCSVDQNADLYIHSMTFFSTRGAARSSQELWLQVAVFQVIGKRGLRAWRKVCCIHIDRDMCLHVNTVR